jgi:hypothetical protein
MASPFGIKDEKYKKATGETLSDVVETWANIAIAEIKKNLQDSITLPTSKMLEQSITPLPVKVNKGITVDVKAASYFHPLNKGVQGVGGDSKSKIKWRNKAPSSPFKFKPGKKPSASHFEEWSALIGRSPFAVRETVYRSGIKPHEFFDKFLESDFKERFKKAITDNLSRTIEVDIKSDFDGK